MRWKTPSTCEGGGGHQVSAKDGRSPFALRTVVKCSLPRRTYDVGNSDEGGGMPKYLLQGKLMLDGVKGVLAAGGTARRDAARAVVESVGGTLESYYFAFGTTDVFTIADLPDNATAAAVALTVSRAGSATVDTVVTLTPEEIDAAGQKSVTYTLPGQ